MKRKIFTIGYTGFTLDEFLDTLARNQVECLIDVREIPISRKKGFAKTALSNALSTSGISYEHFRPLGSPKELRHQVREDRQYIKFFAGVHKHIREEAGREAITQLLHISQERRSCIMCCCPRWDLCHRKCIVDVLTDLSGMTFSHLQKSDVQPLLFRKAA